MCELHLRLCSISRVGVYCMITIPAVVVFQALWWSLLPLRHSLPPQIVSGPGSLVLKPVGHSYTEIGCWNTELVDRAIATLLGEYLLSTSFALISYPATHICSTSFIPSLFAFQEDSLRMCFNFLSEADCSPRYFQDPSLGDLKNWMVDSNFGTRSCFFANIFQVRHGVLDILSYWFHPHGNEQYEQEWNLVLLEDFFDPLFIILRCDLISSSQEVKGKKFLDPW